MANLAIQTNHNLTFNNASNKTQWINSSHFKIRNIRIGIKIFLIFRKIYKTHSYNNNSSHYNNKQILKTNFLYPNHSKTNKTNNNNKQNHI